MHRAVGGGSQRAEHQQHFILFDELPGLLDRLGRRVRIIEADELYLSAVDAALGVDLLEISFLCPTDDAEPGHRAAVWESLADADLVLAVVGRGSRNPPEAEQDG